MGLSLKDVLALSAAGMKIELRSAGGSCSIRRETDKKRLLTATTGSMQDRQRCASTRFRGWSI